MITQHEPQQRPDTVTSHDLPLYSATTSAQETIDFGELVQVAFRRRWLIIIGLILIFGLGMARTLTEQPIFEATTSIIVTSDRSMYASMPNPLQAITQTRSVDTQVEILKSADLQEVAFYKLSADERLKGFGSEDFTGASARINATKNTDVITINVRAQDADAAASYANSIAQTYLEQDLENNRKETGLARAYVERQLEKVRGDLSRANSAFAAYKEKSGLVAPDAQLVKLATYLVDLQIDHDKAVANIQAGETSLRMLEAEITRLTQQGENGKIETATTWTQNPRVAATLDTLAELTRTRTELLQEYTPQSPEVKAIDAQFTEAQGLLSQWAKDDLMLATSRTVARPPSLDSLTTTYATSLANTVAEMTRARVFQDELKRRRVEVGKLPAAQKTLTELMMNVDLQSDAVTMLANQYQSLLISEEAAVPNVRVVAHARAPKVPVSPRIKISAVFFFLFGLLFGLGLAFIAEKLDTRIHDQESAEKVTGLVTMGIIHEIDEDDAKVIQTDDQKSQLVERFRVLRNNISFSALDRQIRSIAITSAAPAEGKSTSSTNLGIVMAMDGKRVIIVDCDLHRPSQHNQLNASREVGLTNVIMGSASIQEAVVATQYAGLDFLSTGILPSNPSEVLNSQPARKLFAELSEMYDIVILDCPPCVKLSDVQIISTIVDGMLIVVSANKTSREGLVYSYRALTQVGAPVMGLIMNRLDLSQQRYGYYYGYYYSKYNYYSHYGQDADQKTTKGKRG